MEKISRTKWQELENEFLSGELNDEAFCQTKNLDLEWFRKELAKSEVRDNPEKRERLTVFSSSWCRSLKRPAYRMRGC